MVISHILGQMGRCLAVVTWLELLPHQSRDVMSTCQQHRVRCKEGIVSSYSTHCFVHHTCLVHTGT